MERAIDELRRLAHGIYPAELRDGGVGAGLRADVASAPIPIEVVDGGFGRCDPEVEACIYFCTLEAVQNAVKHGGRDIRVEVVLTRERDAVRFAVRDDGVAFDAEAERDGFGLASMRDRLAAVGGELAISSAPGRGTSVRGAVPVGVPAQR